MRIALCSLLLFLVIAGGVASAGISDPIYQEWVTLTPLPSPAVTQAAAAEIGPIVGTAIVDIAETTVQGYQMFNTSTNIFTIIWGFVLIVITLIGIRLIFLKVQSL